MKITRYGIILERLQPARIEMVRQWRNDPKIAQAMFFQNQITPAMQQEWFDGIDNGHHYYFIIHYKGAPVGLINISSINWYDKSAEAGLFIYEEELWGSDVPVMASLAMLDVFILLLSIQTVRAKVKGDNTVAHKYNTALGFKRGAAVEHGKGFEYLLRCEDYLPATHTLRTAAIRLRGNQTQIELLKNHVVDEWIAEKLESATSEAKNMLDVKLILPHQHNA